MSKSPSSYFHDAAARQLVLDPRDDDFVQDPYSVYAQLHADSSADGPVLFWQNYGHWVFGGLETVNALFRDRRLGRQILHLRDRQTLGWATPKEHLVDFDAIEARSLLELEPPDHTRLRGLVNRAFLSRHVEALGPEIAQEAQRAMDGWALRPVDSPVDLLADYAEPIAGNIIARMLGISPDHVPQLLSWSHDMVQLYAFGRNRAVEDAANQAARAFAAFVRREVAGRRRNPGSDLLSHLISAHEHGERLSEQEIISTTILLLNAGHEATVHAMGNGLAILLTMNATERHAALEAPDALAEEILRCAPPLHMFTRYVLEDCQIAGVPLKFGDTIGLHIGMANHDPRATPSPMAFDPSRTAIRQVAFGAGLHFCIGHGLARLELAIAIPLLLNRFPTMQLAGKPRFKQAYHFHGLERLMVAPGISR